MLSFLGEIIGEEEDLSPARCLAQADLLALVSPIVDRHLAKWLDKSFSANECFEALKLLGVEKSLGWDGLTIPFFLHFWKALAPAICSLVNLLFEGAEIDHSISKGLVTLIPNLLACSQPKHWRPITMLPVINKIDAKAMALRLMPFLQYGISPHQHGSLQHIHQLSGVVSFQKSPSPVFPPV